MNEIGLVNHTIWSNICRICIQRSDNVREATGSDLNSLEIVIGKNINTESTLSYFCLYCRHLLQKFSKFSQQCQSANNVMHNFQLKTTDFPLITSPYHNFTTTVPKIISFSPTDDEFVNDLKTESNCDDDEHDQFRDDEENIPLSMLNQSISADFTQKTTDIPLITSPYHNFTTTVPKIMSFSPTDDEFVNDLKIESNCADDEHDQIRDHIEDIPLSMLNQSISADFTQLLPTDIELKEDSSENNLEQTTKIKECQAKRKKKKKKERKGKKKKKEALKEKEKKCSVLREGFTSKMVQETDEYIVIKLTREQVLQELAEKLKSPAYLRAPFKCERCAKGFNFEDTLRNHMVKHSMEQGTFPCDICFQFCPSSVSLRGHNKSHTTRYKCKQCGLVLLSRQHLLDHYRVTHRPECVAYTCHYCSFHTNKRTIMQRHVKTHNSVATHPCDACGRLFKSVESLRVHKSRRHDPSAMFPCPHCPRRFVLHTQLQRHLACVNTHSHTHNYCVECDIPFNSQEGFKTHLKKSKRHRATQVSPPPRPAVAAPTPQQLQCGQCGRACGTARALASHVRRHAPAPRSNKCQHCPEAFTHMYLLRRHLRVHTGERPYPCAECHMRFAQSSTRDTHTRLVHRKLPRKVKGAKDLEIRAQLEKRTECQTNVARETWRKPETEK